MDQSAVYPSLRGRSVLISGGAEGIGAAAVDLFARQGAAVTLLDVADAPARALCARLAGDPGVATAPVFLGCDVTDRDALRRAAATALAAAGGAVDVLVNNAGAAASRGPTAGVSAESFAADVALNLGHVFWLTQAVAPAMAARGRGCVINVGSISWRIAAADTPAYTAAKAGVLGLTRTHAREFGPAGVRVVSVMPGSIATRRQLATVLTDEYRAESLGAQCLKRVLEPVEVARVMVFLASDDASAVTASSYVVDGGWVGDP